jgi:hypothetical protein
MKGRVITGSAFFFEVSGSFGHLIFNDLDTPASLSLYSFSSKMSSMVL